MSQKSVLITGCSAGGIGHALALSFRKRGLRVFATAPSVAKMQDLANLSNVHLLALDVTDPAAITAAAKEVEAITGGKLDVLVNNAGRLYIMPGLDVDIAKAKELFDVNYWGPLVMTQAFSSMLIASKGCVINIGSVAGVAHIPFQSQYNASKSAINMLSETLRLELAPLNVRVITLMAGNVASKIYENGPPPPKLPPTSQYLSIEKSIGTHREWPDIPTEKFAEDVVSKTLSGKTGKLWLGGNAAFMKWVSPFMPVWMLDMAMIKLGRGIDQMPKLE